MDRQTLKQNAKESIKNCKTNAYLVSFIYMIVTSFLGNIQRAFDETETVALVVAFVAYIASLLVGAGYSWWTLSVARDNDDTNEFRLALIKIVPIFIATLLTTIICAIGMILLIVPGIIAVIGLSMTFYCLRDDFEAGAIAAMKKSWEIMKGHKMDYFVLYLSFIPWMLLAVVTFGIAGIYVYPYMSTTIANFYDEIKDN